MAKNEKIKISTRELVPFFMEYISKHSYYKITNLVKIYMKNDNAKIDNGKIRTHLVHSLSNKFSVISKRALKLNIVSKDNKVYKILGEPYVLSNLTLKKD